MTQQAQNCPLCGHHHSEQYHQDKLRDYWRCPQCDLVFVPVHFHLSPEQEKAVYDQHENNPNDSGYRRFLSRAWTPLKTKLSDNSKGLDFGSGPGPTLSLMAQEDGFHCAIYDLYYANDPAVLINDHYDFITSTEVIEHLAHPKDVISQLINMVKVGGYLSLMTKRHQTQEQFRRWHYILDPTHITFYSEKTFYWIAKHFNCSVEFPDNDVAILRRMT